MDGRLSFFLRSHSDQLAVASRGSEFEAGTSREKPTYLINDVCHGLGGRAWGMVARVFCHPEDRAMIVARLCITLLDYIF